MYTSFTEYRDTYLKVNCHGAERVLVHATYRSFID